MLPPVSVSADSFQVLWYCNLKTQGIASTKYTANKLRISTNTCSYRLSLPYKLKPRHEAGTRTQIWAQFAFDCTSDKADYRLSVLTIVRVHAQYVSFDRFRSHREVESRIFNNLTTQLHGVCRSAVTLRRRIGRLYTL